jgi:branched-chain amino acid aminotransferase
MMEFSVERAAQPRSEAERARILADPGFGRFFTDHMVSIEFDRDRGWHDAKVVPYGPITLDPATNFIHYGQAIFEGMKAYRHTDGHIRTFRPLKNAERFQSSARRLAMPELPVEDFVQSLMHLIAVDGAWVPGEPDKSLYLRPFMYSTEVGLGVKPADSYRYLLIASPAGAYFPRGVAPVSVWLTPDYVRAAVGGTGEAKCAGNYAASLVAQAEASLHDCDQVVWLDAKEHEWVEEMGGMNLFFVFGSGDSARLVTPPLTGSLLPGVTRDSILILAGAQLGLPVAEEPISVTQWKQGCESGEITEVFACGTAAVVTPVGQVKSRVGAWTVGDGGSGPVTMGIRNALLGIQSGQDPDVHAWMFELA